MPRAAAMALLGAALALGAAAQANRDPLTAAEANQLRDATDNPPQRIALLLGFAQDRLEKFERIRLGEDPSRDRPDEMYSRLEQYAAIIPELDDNLDDLDALAQAKQPPSAAAPPTPKINLLKLYAQVIASERDLTAILHHIETASNARDFAGYRLMLQDCEDVTAESLQDAQRNYADLQAGRKIGGAG